MHVEAYPSPDAVREEEFSPALALHSGAPLIISADDSYAFDRAVRVSTHIISYGMADDASVRIIDADFYEEEGRVVGMRANVKTGTEEGSLVVKGSVGTTQLLPVAAALAAVCVQHTFAEAVKALKIMNRHLGAVALRGRTVQQ